MNRWNISHNKYSADEMNPRLRLAYWEGHRDFAYDLVRFVRPKRIVELGSQYGCSLSAFCQSVLDNQLNTEIHAVDRWSGDIGAEDLGEDVFQIVKKTVERYYQTLQIRLYPMDFQKALALFLDDSIQLLHIDGGHTYEDVDRDFRTWLPKLEEEGIILFHDIYSKIDAGSCEHWEHLKTEYKNWFEFKHSCGLGILFPKGDFWYRKMLDTDFKERCQDIYSYRALYEYTQIRYQELCENYEQRYQAMCQQDQMIDERDREIKTLTQLVQEKAAAEAENAVRIDEKDREIAALTEMVKKNEEIITKNEKVIAEKNNTIRDLKLAALENSKWKQVGSFLKIRYR